MNAIPNAKLLVLEGIGHYPGTEYPGFEKIVTEFVNSLGSDI